MSKYTVEFGTLYDSGFAPLLEGLEYYPLFDESHREELNKKIYNRYKFREIGFETAAVFTHYFITLINEIMPYYNELYRTAARDYDFLSDADLTETENVATNSSSSGTSNSSSNDSTQTAANGKDTRARSDTPQGSFNFSAVADNTYLTDAEITETGNTSATNSNGQTASTTSAQGAGQSARTKRITGKSPGRTYADMVREYRETILNIDKMILDELNVCFMGVY